MAMEANTFEVFSELQGFEEWARAYVKFSFLGLIVESRGESWRIVENRGMVEGVRGESWGKPSRKPSRKLSGSLEI